MIVNHLSWLMALTLLFFSTSGVHADTEGDIDRLIEEFGVRCAEVMESPEDFYRSARAEENENNIAVMQSEDGQIHWILQIDRQPEFSSVFIEIDGKTQVTCSYFIGTDAHQEATDRNNNVFLAAISELNGARVTGGAIDVDGNLSALSGDPL